MYHMMAETGRVAKAFADDRLRMAAQIERYAERRRRLPSLPASRRAVEQRALDVTGAFLKEQAAILDRAIARENAARKKLGLSPI